MKKYLAVALLLCALLSLAKSACFIKPELAGKKKRNKACSKDHVDKTWHAVGSKWRNSQCLDCTCDRCCALFVCNYKLYRCNTKTFCAGSFL
uniref:Uncharacterized protein n=1 Tax=Amphilophus citrinellus TaxID=61819 RepID=A0A3Q0RIQ9_AMPCI